MPLHDAAFYFCAFFIVGIFLYIIGAGIWATAGLAAVITFFLQRKNKLMASALSLFILVGFFYAHFHGSAQADYIPFAEAIVFHAVVFVDPEGGQKSQKVRVALQEPYRGNITAYLPLYPEFSYGDLLEFKGVIDKSPSGRANVSLFPEVELIAVGYGNEFKAALFAVKNRLIAAMQSTLSPHNSALASGLLLGERAEFSEEFEEAMRVSGTTHIVALSGFNISIIGMMVSNTLGFFMNRRKSFYITLAFITAFVLMTGAEASVVRAGIMGIIILLATQSGRIYNFRNAITITALAMLLLNPGILVYDVGFQLSFAALLGIIYLEPWLKERLPLRKDDAGFLNWRDNLRQTSAAQLAVLPILLVVFGYFSPLSLAANVLILGLIPITMFFSFITSLVGLMSINLSVAPALLTGALLGYETFIIHLFALDWI